jgi:hypothetical protein
MNRRRRFVLPVFLGEKLLQPVRGQKCVLGSKERMPHHNAVAFAAKMISHDGDRVESVRVQGDQFCMTTLVNENLGTRSCSIELIANGNHQAVQRGSPMFAGRHNQPFDVERSAFESAGQRADQLVIEHSDLHELVSRLEEFVIDIFAPGIGRQFEIEPSQS